MSDTSITFISTVPVPSRSSPWKVSERQRNIGSRRQFHVNLKYSERELLHVLNMASSLTRQQVKLSKSMISLSAYRATSIWYSLLLSLNPTQEADLRSVPLAQKRSNIQEALQRASPILALTQHFPPPSIFLYFPLCLHSISALSPLTESD